MLAALTGRTGVRMASNAAKFTNKLALEKSPYLLQHKNNPIEWYPWGEEAFNLAKTRNVPIFLSVGYSTCHWCHVMERESFENDEIAKLLNDNFVSIKVDREERPDVDRLYMMFVQATTGGGGWPMSVFMTPEREPFLGGTYFPPFDKYGRPGFATLLGVVAEKWKDDTEILRTQGRTVMTALSKVSAPGEQPPVETAVMGTFQHLTKGYDKEYGGFGIAPKFPKAVDLNFLLNFIDWSKSETEKKLAQTMLDHTLKAMAQGGIHDHVGKGFHRYSVDEEWHVPHFEKMLYDQAQLLAVYSDYSILTGGSLSEIVRDVADYMTTALMHSEGGFYAAEDADSLPTFGAEHKKEGAFCAWKREQVHELLNGLPRLNGHPAADVFCDFFDIKEDGNVPHIHDPHGELKGVNVLRCKVEEGEFAKRLGVELEDFKKMIANCKEILFAVRLQRPPPHLDSKMVTAWQGLAITGFSKASVALSDPSLLDKAVKCANFVEKHLTDESGHLLRAVYRGDHGEVVQSEKPVAAFSDDYAFVIQGFLDLYACSGDEHFLRRAYALQKTMDEKFFDHTAKTGYFISESGSSGADVRIQEDQDGAEPCANSVCVGNLAKLSDIFGDTEMSQRAEQVVAGAAQRLVRYPYILTKMVAEFKSLEDGHQRVVIVGKPEEQQTKEFRKAVLEKYAWNRCVVHLNPEKKDSFLASHCAEYAPMLDVSSPTVFVCEGSVCSLPIRSFEDLRAKLSSH